jgi:hypothetical protein
MDTVVKNVNIIRASALDYQEFVGFLEETESEYYEIIYHTNVSCSSKGSVL